MLQWPAGLGVILYVDNGIRFLRGEERDYGFTAFYAVFLSVWATVLAERWTKNQNDLAYMWGVTDFEENEKTRPHFLPSAIKINPVTGVKEPTYPPGLRFFKHWIVAMPVDWVTI